MSRGPPSPRRRTWGLIEWLRPGEHARAEAHLRDMDALGVTRLRTRVSWADWHSAGGRAWYDWLLPLLAARVERAALLHLHAAVAGHRAQDVLAAARRRRRSPTFSIVIITRLRRALRVGGAVERAQQPVDDWDWRLDPGWELFAA